MTKIMVLLLKKKKLNETLYPKSKGECVYFVNDGGDVNAVITENIISAIRDKSALYFSSE